MMPWLAQVDLDRGPKNALNQVSEVAGGRLMCQVIALALDGTGARIVRRRRGGGVLGEEDRVADEEAADDRVLARPEGR